MTNAKGMGYKVIDEFGIDIASRVRITFENGKAKVTDEFDCDITSRVKIERSKRKN